MFGIAFSVKSRVSECTPALLYQAIDDRNTHAVCAEIADALEMVKRGEMSREDFETLKSDRKRQLPILTPHATFRNGRRVNDEAVPSGLSMYDVDHISDPRGYYQSMVSGRETELGIAMAHVTPSTEGLRLFFIMPEGMTLAEAQQWMSRQLGDDNYDGCVKDLARCSFLVPRDYILYMDEEELFNPTTKPNDNEQQIPQNAKSNMGTYAGWRTVYPEYTYKGHKVTDIIDRYMEVYGTPEDSQRHLFYNDMVTNFRHICNNQPDVLADLLPPLDVEAPMEQVYQKRLSQCQSICRKNTASRLPHTFYQFLLNNGFYEENGNGNEEHSAPLSNEVSREGLGVSLPRGASDSVAAVGQHLAMPVVTAICPCIGALATGVRLDVHGTKRGLNLIAYIAGDFASGKGQIDPVVEAWMSEQQALDKMYQMQEDEWRQKKRAAKNKKEQPEEPKLPVRCLTLNNTVANLAERLANTEGKHAFSFTPEADTVAQKWKSSLSDFSVMLRQSYDGSRYDREARSAEAVNVHIDSLLWNVVMCGTPDALYRVVSNYTDGFQSRIAVASTPDNTFFPLEAKPCVLTDRQRDRIQQVAHLLPLMHGEVVLPKLEQRGREWLEKVRLDSMMNDDRTRARQRFRVCVTAQRMTCCLMLCRVCDQLIRKHGLTGAETQLKQYPNLWKEMLLKAQTSAMLEAYDQIADYLLDTALYYFRERIENAFQSRDYVGGKARQRVGRNDSIYERLDTEFSFEQAFQQTVAVKGAGVTRNSVQQMLKNWRKQGIARFADNGKLRKVSH